jgi:hypothetical protein
VIRGFVRAPDGTITTFDALPNANNPIGTITGVRFPHGFVLAPDGTFTRFDVPSAFITLPTGITPNGIIAGSYIDESFVFHGFVRIP